MNETKSLKKTRKLVGMGIFTALVVVLQLLAGSIKIGTFSPSLVLIPIVIGAAVYGAKAGAWLGLVFGIVVLVSCITGADSGGWLMWGVNPAMTALICLGKGTAAGFLSGLTFRALQEKHEFAAAIAASVVCPVVNTGLFVLGAVAAFMPLLTQWAEAWAAANGQEGTKLVVYLLVGMIGLNFLLEMLINIILSPIVVRILKARKQA